MTRDTGRERGSPASPEASLEPGVPAEARDDADLLARHVTGDPDAFAVLVARHRDRLWAVALRTLGDPDDAADALQDALVRAFRRAETFRGDAAVTTWLHRVVVNACLDQLRRRRARPVELLDPLDDPALGHRLDGGHGLSGAATDPAVVALQREQREQVRAALATLPPEQRAALVLVDMQGWSVAEAAQVLDCPVGTVKSRCARGRARLAPLLADQHPILVEHSTGPGSHPGGNRSVRNLAPGSDVPPEDSQPPSRGDSEPESMRRST